MVEQEGHGMREDFAQQPTGKVPEVAGPHPLYTVALGELRKDGVYSVTEAAQKSASFRIGISLLGGVRSQKLYANDLQLLLGLWRMVVAVPNDQPRSSLDDLRHDGKLVGIGRCHRDASDHSRPRDPRMHPETVEGLLEERILAESGFSTEALTPVGTSEQTRRKRHRIHEREGGVVRNESKEFLPEALFDLPEVCRLRSKGSSMYLTESRKPLCVVPLEEEIYGLVGVESQELSYDLDGQYLRVRELRSWPALTVTPLASFEMIIYQAEDRDDEGAKIHEQKTSFCSRWIGVPPRVGRSSTLHKFSKKLAHGVNYIEGVDLSQYEGQFVTIYGIFQTQGNPISNFDDPTEVPIAVTEVYADYDPAPEAKVTGLIQPIAEPMGEGPTHTITETETGDVYGLWSDTQYTGIDLTQYEGTQSTIYGIFQTQGSPISDFEDPTDVLIAVNKVEVLNEAPSEEPDAIITGVIQPTANPEAEGSTHTITEDATGDVYGLFSNLQDGGVDLSQYGGQQVTITGYFQTQGGSISDFPDPTEVLIYVESVEVLDSAPATDDQYQDESTAVEDSASNDTAAESGVLSVLPDTGGFPLAALGLVALLLLGGGGLLAYNFVRR